MAVMTWKTDDRLSCRAFQNAYAAREASVAVMVDIEAGAFAGDDTIREMKRAHECLTVAIETAERRWVEFLDSKHGEKAA